MKETCGTDPGIESWYVEFQGAVLNNLPRSIPKHIALKWANSGEELFGAFQRALLSAKAQRRLLFDARPYTIKISSTDGRTKQQILAATSYSKVPLEVTLRDIFLIRPIESAIEIEVLDFHRNISSKDAIAIAESYGLQRPSYEHALLFAEQHLKESIDNQGPIVFLHEPWNNPFEKLPERSKKVMVLRKTAYFAREPELILELHSFDKPEWGNRLRYRAMSDTLVEPEKYGPELWEGYHKFAFVCPPGQ